MFEVVVADQRALLPDVVSSSLWFFLLSSLVRHLVLSLSVPSCEELLCKNGE